MPLGAGPEHSIARVPPPLFVGIIDKVEETVCETRFYSCSIAQARSIDNEALEALRRCRRRMLGTPEMFDYYTATLNAYTEGLDATTRNERYLMFWRAIESAVIAQDIQGSTQKVATRAAKLAAPSADLVSLLAKTLGSVRNKLVHGLTSAADHPYAIFAIHSLAQHIVERAIHRACSLKTTTALREYFRLCDKGSTDLDGVQRAIHLILKSR